jgi:hypothetical protein
MASSSLARAADLTPAFLVALGRDPLALGAPFALAALDPAVLAVALALGRAAALDLGLAVLARDAFDLDAPLRGELAFGGLGAPALDALGLDADEGLLGLDLGFWVGVLRLVNVSSPSRDWRAGQSD